MKKFTSRVLRKLDRMVTGNKPVKKVPAKAPTKTPAPVKAKKEISPNKEDIIVIEKDVANFIVESRKEGEIKDLYYDLMQKNYIYYQSEGNQHKFIKRDKAAEYFCKNYEGYHSKFGQLYTIEKELKPRGMIVIFSSNPSPKNGYYESTIARRYFVANFGHIQKYVPDDVMVLRIADLNRHIGTMYMPTEAYPNYEDDVNNVIQAVAAEYDINDDKIFLLGASKGGTGAVYYGLRYNYNFIGCDPILDIINSDIDRSNYNFVEDCAKDLVKFDFEVNFTRTHGYSICSPRVPENYVQNTMFKEKFPFIKLVESDDERIKSHSEVAKYTQKWVYAKLYDFFGDDMVIK